MHCRAALAERVHCASAQPHRSQSIRAYIMWCIECIDRAGTVRHRQCTCTYVGVIALVLAD